MIKSHLSWESIGRVASEPFVITLAAVDVLIVVAFIAFGLLKHAIEPWAFPAYTLRTAIPFVIGWVAVAPLFGAYRRRVFESFRRTLAIVAVAWVVASLLGGAIRSTALFPGSAPPEFLLVTAVLGLGFVLPWRLAVTAGVRRR
ncbi:DUF3054 domain-containing protein [Natrinema amylolyticum]|uniref:DUF3054 domain-containing protein n=1 Tax=Natrinema amylolyticum TaxID=2878679 RepID=UPI001CFA5F8C|nr:DUF3054 domain-containing protein [Natrinema amylolyticum]